MGEWESPNGVDRVSGKAQMVIEGQVGEPRWCGKGGWESPNSIEGQWEGPDSDRIIDGRAQMM